MAESEENRRIYSFDDFELDADDRQLLRAGVPIQLSAKALDLLIALVENAGRLVSKDELFAAVWNDQIVEESNLTVHVSQIRKALGESKVGPKYIETVPAYGYRFVREVTTPVEEEVVVETHTISRVTIENEISDDAPLALPPRPRSPLIWLGIAAVLAALVAGFWFLSRREVNSTDRASTHSIAVLPFRTLNGASSDDGLELGLTESLITRLSGLQNISIRPAGAVTKYGGPDRDLRQIGADLQVDSIVEGSIQREGERLRLTVRLVKSSDGSTVWDEQIDERFADIFAVQDRISNRVATSLELVLSDTEKRQLSKVNTQNIEAYKKFLVGRYHWNKRSKDGLYESIKFYNEAIDLDPTFALAFSGLADTYLLIGLYGIEPPTEAFPKARSAAEKALNIDPALAEADASLAMVYNLFEYNWKQADEHFRGAVTKSPGYSTGHHWYGLFLAMQGRAEEAMAHLTKAKYLDPLSPSINTDVAFASYLANDRVHSLEQLEKVDKLAPNFLSLHNVRGMNHISERQFDLAIQEFTTMSKLSNGEVGLPETIWATGFSGDAAKARRLLSEFPKDKTMSPFDRALIDLSLGENDGAVSQLYTAYQQRDPQIVAVKVFPPLQPLRQNAKFLELLKMMHLD